jgi:translation initiation factor 4E
LALIGEQFDHGDEICGAVVSVRARQEKIAIWTKNASNEAAQVVLSKRKEDYIYIYIYIGLFALDRKLQ